MKNALILFISLLFIGSAALAQEDSLWNQKNEAGKKEGKWRAYHPNGKLRYTGQFNNDQPIEVFRYFFATGDLQSVLTFEEPTKANARLFYQTGDLMAEGLYVNQKREGKWTSYGAENIKVEDGLYEGGEKVGLWKTYYANGAVSSETNFEKGVKTGDMKLYYESGSLKREAIYKDDRLEGPSIFYRPDGEKLLEGKYENDLRVEKWKYYDNENKIEKVLEYQEGVLLNPDVLENIIYDTDPYKDNVKDMLEFDDLRGKIRYEYK